MNKIIILSLALLTAGAIKAQTPAEKLEQAVAIYNHMRNYEDDLRPSVVKEADIDTMQKAIAAGVPLLEDVMRSGSAEEAKTARYFKANFIYELGFIYGMMGRNKDAFAELSTIKSEYEFFSAASEFPLKYVYTGKNYSIKYDNFAPTLAEYYTGMSEICANLSKLDDALYWARKAHSFSYTTDWYKYIAVNKILEVKKKQDHWDKEMADMALEQIKAITKLDTSYQRTVKENNYPTQKLGYDRIVTIMDKDPGLARGEYYRGVAAPLLESLKDYERALAFYRQAIIGNYTGMSKEYLMNAARLAKSQGDKNTCLFACDKLMSSYSSSMYCSDWTILYDYYQWMSENSRAREAKNNYDDCIKRQRKQNKRSNRGSGNVDFAISTNPTNFFYNCQLAVADLRLGKTILEGRYQKFNDVHSKGLFGGHFTDPKKEWKEVNGADYSLGLFFVVDDKESYNSRSLTLTSVGFQALMSDFTTQSEMVIYRDANTGLSQSTMLHPKISRQELTFNWNIMTFSRKTHLFFSFYMGLGAGRRTMDYGNTNNVDLSDSRYEFSKDEVNYGYTQKRWNTVYMQMRLGCRLGLLLF